MEVAQIRHIPSQGASYTNNALLTRECGYITTAWEHGGCWSECSDATEDSRDAKGPSGIGSDPQHAPSRPNQGRLPTTTPPGAVHSIHRITGSAKDVVVALVG